MTFLGTEVPRGRLHLLDPPTCSGADTTLWPQDKEEGWTDPGQGIQNRGVQPGVPGAWETSVLGLGWELGLK